MITEPKEKPILFSDEMVKAILDGRKTQTRRVVKSCKAFTEWTVCHRTITGPENAYDSMMADDGNGAHFLVAGDQGYTDLVRCPYGPIGTRLWVREAWAQNWNQLSDERMDQSVVYRADGKRRAQDNGTDLPWRPSTHMPRWASRIALEVTDVRVERVQEIDALDALAEGVTGERVVCGTLHESDGRVTTGEFTEGCPRDGFRNLWDSINAKRGFGWDVNPWVWVITFKRIQP